jgi:hypothetical protein
MNDQTCECYQEWMSLAQDGMLTSAQSRLLHEHLSTCPSCRSQWEAMALISRMFHAAPIIGPAPGFVIRFQGRLARREEQRRRAMVMVLLGIGVVALTILALPSLIGLLGFTGQLILPYWLIAYVQQVLDWAYLVLNALLDAVRLLLTSFATTSSGLACISSAAIAGALILIWVPAMVGHMAKRKVD